MKSYETLIKEAYKDNMSFGAAIEYADSYKAKVAEIDKLSDRIGSLCYEIDFDPPNKKEMRKLIDKLSKERDLLYKQL